MERSKAEMRKMCPQQRARCLAYQPLSKEVQGWMARTNQRLRSQKQRPSEPRRGRAADGPKSGEMTRRDTLVGQLKAAEARGRIRETRLRHQSLKVQEINLMISCQSSAQRAARLELLLMPVTETEMRSDDCLDKLQVHSISEKAFTFCFLQ
uniref:Uncharacterized protein n=1 Tax=Denticeps clupeoides TaxID=299321 RepID=A0AAY4DTU5_9TELE